MQAELAEQVELVSYLTILDIPILMKRKIPVSLFMRLIIVIH